MTAIPCHAQSGAQGESFDVTSIMETNDNKYNAREILGSNKEEAIRWREKMIAGY